MSLGKLSNSLTLSFRIFKTGISHFLAPYGIYKDNIHKVPLNLNFAYIEFKIISLESMA